MSMCLCFRKAAISIQRSAISLKKTKEQKPKREEHTPLSPLDRGEVALLLFIFTRTSLYNVSIQTNGEEMKKKYPPKPNGKNIEISLELLELSLLLKQSVRKALKKK